MALRYRSQARRGTGLGEPQGATTRRHSRLKVRCGAGRRSQGCDVSGEGLRESGVDIRRDARCHRHSSPSSSSAMVIEL